MSNPVKFEDVWPEIQKVPGFMVPGQEEFLFNTVSQLPEDAVIVEIGSFMGRSTTAMAYACKGTCRRIYAIDSFRGNSIDFISGQSGVEWKNPTFRRDFEANLERNGVRKYVTPLCGFSNQVSHLWSTEIDFLFVDGSHVYRDVIADFDNFYPWVKPGGLLGFHDVTPDWEGPFDAWHEVIKPYLDDIGNASTLAYGRKRQPKPPTDIHVVIPVFNRKAYTRRLLTSLMEQTVIDRMIIHVVDDGSSDGTAEMLATEFPDVDVIKGDGNLWWTGAVAKAIKEIDAGLSDDDYILLCNNDSVLSKDTVETLVQVSRRERDSAVAARAFNEQGIDVPAGGYVRWLPGQIGQGLISAAPYHGTRNVVEVHAIFGRCCLFPVEMVRSVGSFDAEYFPHYWGDTDFCMRGREKGYRFLVTQDTSIVVVEDEGTTGLHYAESGKTLKQARESLHAINSNNNLMYMRRFVDRFAPDERKEEYKKRYTRVIYKKTIRDLKITHAVRKTLRRARYPYHVVKLLVRKPGYFFQLVLQKIGLAKRPESE